MVFFLLNIQEPKSLRLINLESINEIIVEGEFFTMCFNDGVAATLKLSEKEIQEIISYIRTITKSNSMFTIKELKQIIERKE